MAPVSYTTTTNQAEVLAYNNCNDASNIGLQFVKSRGSLKNFFPGAKGYTIGDSTKNAKRLALYQGIIFGTLFLGYASYTYERKIFSYAAPTLMGLSLLSQSNMGIVNSSQYIAYAISKFLGGLLSDKISAKLLFPAGLFLSGLTGVAVAFSADPKLWAFLWFINGLGQGCGWPACSKLLKKWFSSKQFGTCWSLLTASSNVSGTIGPVIAAYCLMVFGWKTSFIVSGLFSIVVALASVILLQDSPKSAGLDSPDTEEGTDVPRDNLPNINASLDKETSYHQMLKTPLLWIISVCYLIVFATKTALSDWGQVFLIQDLGRTQMQASTFNSAFETGGFIGGVLAGVVTDKLRKKFSSAGNARLLSSTLFMLVCAFSLHCLIFAVSPETPQVAISFIGMAVGGALFGPISIFGIVASESFPPTISGASHAVVALAANVGAIAAGWPISRLATRCGWKHVFLVFEFLMLISIAVIILSRNFHKVKKLKTN